MGSEECPRLQAELDNLRHWSRHTTDDLLDLWATDHKRHCFTCNGWEPSPHLPRDREQP